MTTIVYRDGVMAADSQVGHGGNWVKGSTPRKIVRRADGAVIASSGDWSDALQIAKWFCDGEAGDPPKVDVSSIVAYPDGGVRLLESGVQIDVDSVVPGAYVIGSRFPVALAALMAGADAKRAVEIACIIDPYSGGQVHVIRVSGADAPAAHLDINTPLPSVQTQPVQMRVFDKRIDPDPTTRPSFWLSGVLP